MNRLEALKQKRAELAASLRAMLPADDSVLSAEQSAAYDATRAQLDAVNASIDREAALREVERTVAPAPQPAAEQPRIVVGQDRAVNAPWAGFGEFLQAVRGASDPAIATRDPRLFAAASGMNQQIGSEGGFAVPKAYSPSIWDGLNDPSSSLLALVDQYTVEGESLTFNANAETSRAAGSRYGGVRGYWINEADSLTSSAPKFRQLKLEPQELGVLVYATQKLLDNSPIALEQYVSRAATEEINFLVGDSIVNGTGAGQPKGITQSGCAVTVSKESSQAAATINQQNISKMWARLHPRARGSAVWLHNVDVEPALDTLSTTVTNVAGTENVGGYANKVFDPERRTLKGRPLIACEFCSTLGTAGDLILWDPKGYAAGVRGQVKQAASMHVRFVQAEMAFRFMFAVDGQTWLASALTPFKGSNSLSSVVLLQTR